MNRVKKPTYLHPSRGSAVTRHRVKAILRGAGLHTVCESARCPNLGECFELGTAVFLILGDVCTRRCSFCAIKKGTPKAPDPEEPKRVAEAAARLGLKHAVVTGVTRDDLDDGGASVFAETVDEIRSRLPDATVELLVPDFLGSTESLDIVIASMPDVFNHNVETIPRLYDKVRPGADWGRSIKVLQTAASNGLVTKSGMMLGMGEEAGEVRAALNELRDAGCRVITLGQYLSPSRKHWPVAKYVEVEEFDKWREFGIEIGFKEVSSGPLVRSSYHAKPLDFSTAPLTQGAY